MNRPVREPELDLRTVQPRKPDIDCQRFRNGGGGIEADGGEHILRCRRHGVGVSNPYLQCPFPALRM
jgi:hypothetical protein